MNAYLLHLLFGMTLLLTVALIGVLFLRRCSAAVRHSVLAATMLGVLLIPCLLPLVPHWSLAIVEIETKIEPIHENRERNNVERPDDTITGHELVVWRETTPPFGHPSEGGESSRLLRGEKFPSLEGGHFAQQNGGVVSHDSLVTYTNLPLILLSLWSIGSILLFLRLALSFWAAGKIVTKTLPLDEPMLTTIARRLKIAKPVALRQSEVGIVPFAFGLRKPVIVLPESANLWTAEERRAVLTHELGHVARRDVLWQLLAEFCCAIYWFHPLVWLTAWRLRIEREIACDDLVVLAGEEPPVYASVLLRLAGNLKNKASRRHLLGCTVAMARHHEVCYRIASILNPKLLRQPLGRVGSTILLLVAALGITIASTLSPTEEPTTTQKEPGMERPKNNSVAQSPDNAPNNPATTAQNNTSPPTSPALLSSTPPNVIVVSGMVVDTDGKPVSGAIVDQGIIPDMTTKSDAEGRFRFELPATRRGSDIIMRAQLEDGSRLGFAGVYYPSLANEAINPLWQWQFREPTIVLRPKITMTGKVVDAEGQAVSGASVAATAFYCEVARHVTGEDGTFTLEVPDDTPLNHLFAVKANAGLDYILYHQDSQRPNKVNDEPVKFDYTEPVTLTLGGARRIVVIVRTPEERPAEGIRIVPWLLVNSSKKIPDGGDSWFNTVNSKLFVSTTDENGVATFDWFPLWAEREVDFTVIPPPASDGQREYATHHAAVRFDPRKDATMIDCRLVRLAHPIMGKVLDEEGKPVPGVRVRMDIAKADSSTSTMYSTDSYSDEQGQIRFVVPIGQEYRCMIDDPRWNAPEVGNIYPAATDSVPMLVFVVRSMSPKESTTASSDEQKEPGMERYSVQSPGPAPKNPGTTASTPTSPALLSSTPSSPVPFVGRKDIVWETLGIKFTPIPKEEYKKTYAQHLHDFPYGGVVIDEVKEDSPFAKKNIKPGDVLIGVGGWSMTSINDMRYIAKTWLTLANPLTGKVRIHVIRNGKLFFTDIQTDVPGDTVAGSQNSVTGSHLWTTVINAETNDPFAGVKVTLTYFVKGESKAKTLETASDEAGRVFLPPPTSLNGDEEKLFTFTCAKDNYVPVTWSCKGKYLVERYEKQEPLCSQPKMIEAVYLTGRFVQESGEPISNVSVVVARELKGGDFLGIQRAQSSAIDDAEGKFSIPVGKRESVGLSARHKDFADKRLAAKEPEDQRSEIPLGDIVLKAGFSATIQVLDKDGKPVSDVWVQLSLYATQEELDTTEPLPNLDGTKNALTDANGKATFDHLNAGNYSAQVLEKPYNILFAHESNDGYPTKPTKGVYEPISVKLSPTSRSATIQGAKTVNVIVHFSDKQTTPKREWRTIIEGEGVSTQGVNSSLSTPSRYNGKHLGEGRFSFEVPVQLRGAKLILKHRHESFEIDNETSYRCFMGGKEIEPMPYPLNFSLPSLDADKNIEVVCYKSPKMTLHVVNEAGKPVKEYFAALLYSKRNQPVTITQDDEKVLVEVPGRIEFGVPRVATDWAYASSKHQFRLGLDIGFAWRKFGGTDNAKVNGEGILHDEELRLFVVGKGYDVAEQIIPKMAEGEERELTVTLKPGPAPDNPATTAKPFTVWKLNIPISAIGQPLIDSR